MTQILESARLSKQYGRKLALNDCSISIDSARVIALVGPNGSGKSTLLQILAGLAAPTSGSATLFGDMQPGSRRARHCVAYVAQGAPLYSDLTVGRTVKLAAMLNESFDQPTIKGRLRDLSVSPDVRVGDISGGSQAQLALALALARQPNLLILDEPLASLDPLARKEFLNLLSEGTQNREVCVLMSTHIVSEMEMISDYLIIIADGCVQIDGPLGNTVEEHALLMGPQEGLRELVGELTPISIHRAAHHLECVVRNRKRVPAGWKAREITLEEMSVAYMSRAAGSTIDRPEPAHPGKCGHGDD